MKKKKSIIILLILILLISIILSAFDNILTVKHYKISNIKISSQEKIKIVFLSDLHNQSYGQSQEKLINQVKYQSPDIILLGGDLIDSMQRVDGAKLLLEGITKIAPTYYSTGNHEYWTHQVKKIRDIITSYGVKILEDKSVSLNIKNVPIILYGIEDPAKKNYEDKHYKQAESMALMYKKTKDSSAYKILLAHRPEEISLYQTFNFDLILSGHAHGGQVRIPFIINGLFAPNQGFFPKYAGGLYKFDSTNFIVSRGLYISKRYPRIFNRPEINVIEIQK